MTNKTKIIQGDARQSIAALPESPSFDLIFIDANHEAKGYYFQKARKLIRKGGVIVRYLKVYVQVKADLNS